MTNSVLDHLQDGITKATEGMVVIPAGEFLMGSESGSAFESPVHKVYLDAYYLDSAPVTNAQFAEFINVTGYRTTAERLGHSNNNPDKNSQTPVITWRTFATPGREDHPVLYVSWYDADVYAKSIGKRLPTEAEWEKAARGNLEGKLFPWGDRPAVEGDTNWNRVQKDILSVPPTTPVKSFPPNQYGLYEMSGNVWEWCSDWYLDEYYSLSPEHNPQGPTTGQFRVRRGASWNVREDFRLRCANRGAMPPDKFWPNMGFRCAMSAK